MSRRALSFAVYLARDPGACVDFILSLCFSNVQMPSVVERPAEHQQDSRCAEFGKMNGSIVGNGAQCPAGHHGNETSPGADRGIHVTHNVGRLFDAQRLLCDGLCKEKAKLTRVDLEDVLV